MGENTQTQNNPTIIWQSMWADLFREIIHDIMDNKYSSAFKALELLKVILPPECENDVKDEYPKVKAILSKQTSGYNFENAKEHKTAQLYNDMPAALMELLSKIRLSLYNRHWINKDFSIHPESGKTAKIH